MPEQCQHPATELEPLDTEAVIEHVGGAYSRTITTVMRCRLCGAAIRYAKTDDDAGRLMEITPADGWPGPADNMSTDVVHCRDCVYWGKYTNAVLAGRGDCRARSPVVRPDGMGGAVWPITPAGEVCGDGRARPNEAEAEPADNPKRASRGVRIGEATEPANGG